MRMAQRGVDGMPGGGDGDIWCKHDVIADDNVRIVDQREVKIGVKIVTNRRMDPIGNIDRRFYPALFADFSEHALNNIVAQFLIKRMRMIIFIGPRFTHQSLLRQAISCIQVKLAAVHTFFHIHHDIFLLCQAPPCATEC